MMRCAACHAPLRCTPTALHGAAKSFSPRCIRLPYNGRIRRVARRHVVTCAAASRPRSASPCAFALRFRGRLAAAAGWPHQNNSLRAAAPSRRRAAAMGPCVSVEEKPCPPGTFSSSALLELNLLRAAAMGDVPAAKAALAAGATTTAKTAVRAAGCARAPRRSGVRWGAGGATRRGDSFDCAAPHAAQPCSAHRRCRCVSAARAATAASDHGAVGLSRPHPPPVPAQRAQSAELFATARAGEPQRFDHGGSKRAARDGQLFDISGRRGERARLGACGGALQRRRLALGVLAS